MGWTFSASWPTREAMMDYLLQTYRKDNNLEYVRGVLIGNHHWYLLRDKNGLTRVCLDLLQGGTRTNPGWGYKNLDETFQPYALDCPVSLIREASATQNEAVRAWREKVLAYQAGQALLRRSVKALQAGDVLKYAGCEYRLEENLGRKGWAVCKESNGTRFRMSSHQVRKAVADQLAGL